MKKVNFTLVLTLAMLFMGANLNATIRTSFTIKGGATYLKSIEQGVGNYDLLQFHCPVEAAFSSATSWRDLDLMLRNPIWYYSNINFNAVVPSPMPGGTPVQKYPHGIYSLTEYETATFNLVCDPLVKEVDKQFGPVGTNTDPYRLNLPFVYDIYNTNHAAAMYYNESRLLFFLCKLDYKNGSELRPVISAKVRIGDLVETDFFLADINCRLGMETNSGTAQFLFMQDLSALRRQFGVFMDSTRIVTYNGLNYLDTIYAMDIYIDYTITVNDELNYQGSRAHAFQPPVLIGPEGPGWGGNSKFQLVNEEDLALPDFALPINELSYRDKETGQYYVWYTVKSGSTLKFEVAVEADKTLNVTTNGLKDEDRKRATISDKPVRVEMIYDEELGDVEYNIWEVTVRNIVNPNSESDGLIITLSTSETKSEGGTTGNAAVATDAVWASGGLLFANAANPGVLSVYSITGQLIKTVSISGNYTLPLDRGIYVVQLNGKSYKVVL